MAVISDKARHPAKFSPSVIKEIADMLDNWDVVLDPFGGVGGIFKLLDYRPNLDITCVEMEPEWAAWDDRIICQDAMEFKRPDGFFTAIVTSPAYGNRMSDALSTGKWAGTYINYAGYLGRNLTTKNGAKFQWGKGYRDFHADFFEAILPMLRSGGKLIINVKNHYRNKKIVEVSEWYKEMLQDKGLEFVVDRHAEVSSMKRGRNHELRVPYENVMLFYKG